MKYDPEADPFHQEVHFTVVFPERLGNTVLAEAMRLVGMNLYHDVFAMPCDDEMAEWQSDTYANVDVYCDSQVVDALDGGDRLVLSYPLATVGASYIPKFAQLATTLAQTLGGSVEYRGVSVGQEEIAQILRRFVVDLMENWGEEAGSRELRILIETCR